MSSTYLNPLNLQQTPNQRLSFLLSITSADKCLGKTKKDVSKDDDLTNLVTALPRSYTSRFGEVCFAYGGFGFGWWPSCIFDPRLTEGSVRQTALKNLGKKHLVYFFECHEAPFAVLSDSKLVPWTEGLAENYHLGRTARASGRQRALQFQLAVQAAVIEEDKPLDMRLDSNRNEELAQLLPIPKKKKKRKPTTANYTTAVISSAVGSVSDSDESRMKQKQKKRKSGPLFCRIVKRVVPGSKGSGRDGSKMGNDENIGFIKLASMKHSTFADARKAIKKSLVPEALSKRMFWQFYISTLGPVSTKQETTLGPILPFLRSGVGGNATNGGSIEDPITVVIFEPQD